MKGGAAQHLKYLEKQMDTPFIVIIKSALRLAHQAKDNIEQTGQKAFEYDVDSAIFALDRIATHYDESVKRNMTETVTTIREVK